MALDLGKFRVPSKKTAQQVRNHSVHLNSANPMYTFSIVEGDKANISNEKC